jgi:nitronate monooxygenase
MNRRKTTNNPAHQARQVYDAGSRDSGTVRHQSADYTGANDRADDGRPCGGGFGGGRSWLASFYRLLADQIRAQLGAVRQRTSKPINANFFCHTPPRDNPAMDAAWRAELDPYYVEVGLGPNISRIELPGGPFGPEQCAIVEEFHPEVVSFHVGLPAPELLFRVKATGAKVISSATTVAEARWLEARGCDAIIAQGVEAGGHRGMFLSYDLSTQIGTIALVPQIVDAVRVPVIASGGVTDARGIAAAFVLGAAAVQLGTAYLFCPEAKVSTPHRVALDARSEHTTLTNVYTGRVGRSVTNRIARELGPIATKAPDFPLAAGLLFPLTLTAEAAGSDDFTPLWSGQGAPLGRKLPAGELTRVLAREALARLGSNLAVEGNEKGHIV